MRAKPGVSAAVAMSVLVAGCAGGYTVVDFKTDNGTYSESYLRAAADGKGVRLDLRNSPFDSARAAEVGDTIERAFQQSHRSVYDVAFPTNDADGTNGMRAVVLFNAASNARPEQLCSKPDQPGVEPSDRGLRVAVTLCRGERPMRWVVARQVGADATEPAGVRQLFRNVGYDLFSEPENIAGNGVGGDMM
ncbi:hypothetical protein SAMN05216241_10784 [Limimonas halophila]|uniref:DUF4136 domain-containing protein n=2 Tax=Limimonas halophila TaxID=1082479 RepID=A0A1G7SP78_9PROT|nr:hypothetical protein SAMN05216241_10784 [Limimonas halophila]